MSLVIVIHRHGNLVRLLTASLPQQLAWHLLVLQKLVLGKEAFVSYPVQTLHTVSEAHVVFSNRGYLRPKAIAVDYIV